MNRYDTFANLIVPFQTAGKTLFFKKVFFSE